MYGALFNQLGDDNFDESPFKLERYRFMDSEGEFVTGWVHQKDLCKGDDVPCPIHNPTLHSMIEEPLRIDFTRWPMMERVCRHGIGHPDPDSADYMEKTHPHGCYGPRHQTDAPIDYRHHECCEAQCCTRLERLKP